MSTKPDTTAGTLLRRAIADALTAADPVAFASRPYAITLALRVATAIEVNPLLTVTTPCGYIDMSSEEVTVCVLGKGHDDGRHDALD